MDRETLTEETLAAEGAGDVQRLNELARLERRGRLDEATPKYVEPSRASESTRADSTPNDSEGTSEARDASGLKRRLGEAARLNELAGAEETAEALRRIRGAEDPKRALQRAHRRAQSMGDDYSAGEFAELLDE
jgi:hypothetical protein